MKNAMNPSSLVSVLSATLYLYRGKKSGAHPTLLLVQEMHRGVQS